MKIISFKEIATHLPRGTILWRSFAISGNSTGTSHSVRIEDVPFHKSNSGSYMARVDFCNGWNFEPHVWNRESDQHRAFGLVLFVSILPPPNWNFLVMTGVSKSGNAIFAEPSRSKLSAEDFQSYALASFKAKSYALNAKAEGQLAAYQAIPPLKLPAGLIRAFVGHQWNAAFGSNDAALELTPT